MATENEWAEAPASAPSPDSGAPRRGRARVPSARRSRRRLAFDLTALGIIGVLLVGALGATGAIAYNALYSPQAFVSRYLDLLSQGRAADALELPGVTVDSAAASSMLPRDASDVLLRSSALAPLSDVEIIATKKRDDGTFDVAASYQAGPHHGATTFRVEQDGWIGVAPTWRFVKTPLAAITLTLRGATQFTVNGFPIDTRQISAAGVEANPLDPVQMLVFSPGLYSLAVDTPISESPGVAVLSDSPQALIPVNVQTQPTAKFVSVVQERVEGFLTECATQQVLQPAGCPFGLVVRNRIVNPPVWSIDQQPTVAIIPDGANWKIERTEATAHIQVEIQSLFDGDIRAIDEPVPFFLEGTISITPDGSASILVTPAE